MKWTLFLTLVSISLIAGDGAWKENKEYKYKLVAETFLTFPGSNKINGAISSIRLTIRPLSDNILIGTITKAESVETVAKANEPMSETLPELKEVPLRMNKEFMIHLKNGVTDSLSVDSTMTPKELNQLKFVVSQFQVDTKAQNVMKSETNHVPGDSSSNASYKTMEQTVNGECETTYDIAVLPDYLPNVSPDSIPLPELAAEGEVIGIFKNKNYNNCNQRARYLLDLADAEQKADTNQMENYLNMSINTRILITGSLKDYTLQSSVTTNTVGGFTEYIYLTLESVETVDADSNYSPQNMKNIGNLVFTMDSQKNGLLMDDDAKNPTILVTSGLQHSDDEERWSGCWTSFPSNSAICKKNFSPDWVPIDYKCCGDFLCLGKTVLCKHIYKRCETTSCYFGATNPTNTMCNKEFGDRLPLIKDLINDCVPGFFQAKCCPKQKCIRAEY